VSRPKPKRQCGFVTPPADLSAHDRAELDKFGQYLQVKAAEKAGAPAFVVRATVAVIYPEVAGQMGEEVEG